jgi:hypothetical protein
MGTTSATQVLSRPPFGAGARPIDRPDSDPEPDRTTRSLDAEADRARVLGTDSRHGWVPVPASLLPHDTDAWPSVWAYVGVDLIDPVLPSAVRVLSEHLAAHRPIDRDPGAARRLIRAQARSSAIRAWFYDGDGW